MRLFNYLFLLCVAPSIPLTGYDISSGLVAGWGFDGSSNDISTNGYHATLTNGAGFGTGTNFQCLFPATNGASPKYANAGHGPEITNLSNQMTLAAWVKYTGPNGTGGGRSTIVSRYNTPNIFIFDIAEPPNLLRLVLYTNGGSAFFSSAAAFPTNRWIHVAAVYNGASVVVYTNGVSNFGGSASGNLKGSTTCDLLIGSRADNPSNFVWNGGGIDEVRVYNRALTSMDIVALAAGIPTAALTSVTAGQKIQMTQTLRGSHQSPIGLKETRLILSNSGVEYTNMLATPEGSGGWHASPTLPLGLVSAVVVTTNSNGSGFTSVSVDFQVTTYSMLAVRSVKNNGDAWVGGLVYGPGLGPFDGLRTNNTSGEAVWGAVEAGALVGITNYSPQAFGGSWVVTQFVMPASNSTLIWVISNNPPPIVVTEGNPATSYWFPSQNRPLSIDLPATPFSFRAVTVRIYPLHGGASLELFSGNVHSSRLDIEVPVFLIARITAGLWVVESLIRTMGVDEKRSTVFRKLMMVGR